MADEKKERKFRAWYTHELFELTLEEIQKIAKKRRIELSDNPTTEEIAKVYEEAFAEMDDPWEVTANGDCKVEEI
jgi:hypothetical protein